MNLPLAQLLPRGEEAMKLWYVSRDGKRHLYEEPLSGATDLTRERGEQIGEWLMKHPDIQQMELADQLGLIHSWRRKEPGPTRMRVGPGRSHRSD
jgi:hypothetical protein